MTTRKGQRSFRTPTDTARSYSDAIHDATLPSEINEAMRSAVAAYINSARLRADLLARAQQQGEQVTLTAEDVLDRAAFDQLLDPEFDAEQRRQLFRRLLAAAIAHQRLDGVDGQIINNEQRLRQLWNETCGWGTAVQALLDDPSITEIKILGTTAIGDGPRGRSIKPQAYTSAREPLSRAEFLAQSCGVAWNRSMPSVTLPLHSGMRMHITREPRIASVKSDEPGLLIVMRRSRARPWTLRDLLERGMLDQASAELLALLMHAGCSVIVSGQQGAGKTTLLEALINTRSTDTHIVLIEDNTNEFRLPDSALVTRLRIDDSNASEAWRERQEAVRENLRITPDLVVLSEVRGDEAGAVLQQAESGRATLTTIHADSAQAALQRFARLAAANVPNNSFAGAPEQARHVLSEAFHVVIHVAYAQRLRQRYIQHVMLLDGVHGTTITLVPLISTTIADERISWTCHAQVQDETLVWTNPAQITPERIARRIDDLPEQLWLQLSQDVLSQPTPMLIESGDRERDGALRRARAALRDGAWHDATYYLNLAAQARYDHTVIALIDQALHIPAIVEPIDQELASTTHSLRTALENWNLELARQISERAPATMLIVRRRAGHTDWQQAMAAYNRIQDEVAACQAALTHASGYRQQGDISRALSVIRPFATQYLPPDLAKTLLTARRSLLTQISSQTHDDPSVQQHYLAELEQVNRDLASEQPASTANPPAHVKPNDTPAEPVARPAHISTGTLTEPHTPPEPRVLPAHPSTNAQPAPQSAMRPSLPSRTERAQSEPKPVTQRNTAAASQPLRIPPLINPEAQIAYSAPPMPPVQESEPRPSLNSLTPPNRAGWLDTALAHTRERTRLRQADQTGQEE